MEEKIRHERYLDNNTLLFDECCGTQFSVRDDLRLRCIGSGFMGYVDKDWIPGDNPGRSVQACQCRSMSVSEYRSKWISKYLGHCDGEADSKVLSMFKRNNSFYWTSNEPNRTIVSIAAMVPKEQNPLTVTQLNDTISKVGVRYANKLFFLPLGGFWIILDADSPESTPEVIDHYNGLIVGSKYRNFGMVITSKLSWQEFKRKYSIHGDWVYV